MLFSALQGATWIDKITLTFLIPGHTMMPVDSVHATIEREVKNKTVWAPSEWATIITNSRTRPKPYEVIVLGHDDFYDWKTVQNRLFPQNKNVTTNGEPVRLKDIRKFVFNKSSDHIQFFYELDPDSFMHEINVRKNKKPSILGKEIQVPIRLYKSRLPLSKEKFKNLEDLCKKNIIPSRYHEEYLSMPHKSSVSDNLTETDEEDILEDY